MEYIYYCVQCKKFCYKEMEVPTPGAKCSYCVYSDAVYCEKSKDEYTAMNEEEQNEFKYNIRSIYKTGMDIPNGIKRIELQNEYDKYTGIIVTTENIDQKYQIIGPVNYQISNESIFFIDEISVKIKEYVTSMSEMQKAGVKFDMDDWGILYRSCLEGSQQFEQAFYIAVQELKKKAVLLGANAIVGMKQNIDYDKNRFMLQVYGTAVKL